MTDMFRLNPRMLWLIMVRKFPELIKAKFHSQSVSFVNIRASHVQVFSKQEFERGIMESAKWIITHGGNPPDKRIAPAHYGPLFARTLESMDFLRLKRICAVPHVTVVICGEDVWYIDDDNKNTNERDMAWVQALSDDDTDYLIRSVYENPLRAGVIVQGDDPTVICCTKKHALYTIGNKVILLKDHLKPTLVEIDRRFV